MIHPTAKVSEEVNRKLPARKTTVQLLILYTNPERHSAQLIQADRQTDGQTTL